MPNHCGTGTRLERLEEIRIVMLSSQTDGARQLEALQGEPEWTNSDLDVYERAALARCHTQVAQTELAIPLLEGVIEEARTINDPYLEAGSLQLLGIGEWRQRKLDKALRTGRLAKQVASKIVDRDAGEVGHLQSTIAELEGITHKQLGAIPEAIQCFEDARTFWASSKNSERLARNAINLGTCYRELGDFQQAIKIGMDARRGLIGGSNFRSLTTLTFNMAVLHAGLDDYSSAREQAEQALDYAEQGGIHELSASLQALLTQISVSENDVERVRHHAQLLMAYEDEEIPALQRLNLLASVAESLRAVGDLSASRACFERALGSTGDEESPTELALAHMHQFGLDLDEGFFEAAYAKLPELLKEMEVVAAEEPHLEMLEKAARSAEQAGQPAEALTYERQRYALARKIDKDRQGREVYFAHSRLHVAEARAAQKATDECRKDLELRVEDRTRELHESKQRLENEIVERKRADTERLQLELDLRGAQRLESLGRLATGVAHDFNNLLTVIQGTSYLITGQAESPDRIRELGQQLDATVGRGASLTRRLLAFGGSVDLLPQKVPANQLLGNSRFLLERLIGEDVNLVFDLEVEDAAVVIDVALLDSVFMNLAINARDAMPNGGELKVSARVDVQPKTRSLEIRVHDTGFGIAEEHREAVFDPFFTTKPIGRGTGLGLSSALGILQEMGGGLFLDETSPAGTVFRIVLPLVCEAQASSPVDQAPKSNENPLAGKRALLAEDDKDVREVLTSMVESMGLHVQAVSDGEEARAVLELNQQPPPDVLICDINMPKLSGRDLLHWLRQTNTELPCLLVSGWHGRSPEEEEAQNVAFLKKPMALDALRSKLEHLIC